MRYPHLIGVTAATAVITCCSLLPFLPGRYDNLAVALSAMARVVGTAGLILVPFAVLRLVVERSPHLVRWRSSAALLALAATVPVWVLVFMMAVTRSGFVLGAGVLLGAAYATRRGWMTLARLKQGMPDAPHVVPLYLTVVPLAVAILQFALMGHAVDFSRARAMRNAAPLIAAIEQYRAANGQSPSSLLAVWPDYRVGVIGIETYRYEPHFDAYNLAFEQSTEVLGTREFVVYNPRDEQSVMAHASDVLRLTPAQFALEQRRGHSEAKAASAPHWKYFRFD